MRPPKQVASSLSAPSSCRISTREYRCANQSYSHFSLVADLSVGVQAIKPQVTEECEQDDTKAQN